MTRCEMCGYHWKEEGEKYPRCHFDGPEGWAPCEAEEDEDIYDEED